MLAGRQHERGRVAVGALCRHFVSREASGHAGEFIAIVGAEHRVHPQRGLQSPVRAVDWAQRAPIGARGTTPSGALRTCIGNRCVTASALRSALTASVRDASGLTSLSQSLGEAAFGCGARATSGHRRRRVAWSRMAMGYRCAVRACSVCLRFCRPQFAATGGSPADHG
jgi:hypothetical protein